jgi:hypothetical protein
VVRRELPTLCFGAAARGVRSAPRADVHAAAPVRGKHARTAARTAARARAPRDASVLRHVAPTAFFSVTTASKRTDSSTSPCGARTKHAQRPMSREALRGRARGGSDAKRGVQARGALRKALRKRAGPLRSAAARAALLRARRVASRGAPRARRWWPTPPRSLAPRRAPSAAAARPPPRALRRQRRDTPPARSTHLPPLRPRRRTRATRQRRRRAHRRCHVSGGRQDSARVGTSGAARGAQHENIIGSVRQPGECGMCAARRGARAAGGGAPTGGAGGAFCAARYMAVRGRRSAGDTGDTRVGRALVSVSLAAAAAAAGAAVRARAARGARRCERCRAQRLGGAARRGDRSGAQRGWARARAPRRPQLSAELAHTTLKTNRGQQRAPPTGLGRRAAPQAAGVAG